MQEKFRCDLISWRTVTSLARVLADKICATRFRPDIVIAIARGGYVPARLLCDYLDLTDLSSIRIAHYTAGADKQPEASLVDPLARDLKDLNVLLVDDVNDTGDTLELARDHIEGQSPLAARIAVLHHKQISTVQPDFFAKRMTKWRWIIYPWAICEDVTGFIQRLPRRPGNDKEAAAMLERHFGLELSPDRLQDIVDLRECRHDMP